MMLAEALQFSRQLPTRSLPAAESAAGTEPIRVGRQQDLRYHRMALAQTLQISNQLPPSNAFRQERFFHKTARTLP